jgi:hypothetical protein
MKNYDERVMSRVIPEPNSGCWLWIGAHSANGYGNTRYPKNGRNIVQNAHRVVYEIERGHIPKGKVLDHLCQNPACVNPEHLEVVTQGINVCRGNSPKMSAERMIGNQLWRLRAKQSEGR